MHSTPCQILREWKKVAMADVTSIAKEIKSLIPPKTLVLLEGEVGSGKTTLMQAIYPSSSIVSPTYNIIQEYKYFAHLDFYRLEHSQELLALELSLLFEHKDIVWVEWGEKFLKELLREIPSEFEVYRVEILQVPDRNDRNYTVCKIMK